MSATGTGGCGPGPGASSAGSGTGTSNPRKFSEKIALHTQRQAEETAAFQEVMMDISSTRVSACAAALGAGERRGGAEAYPGLHKLPSPLCLISLKGFTAFNKLTRRSLQFELPLK